MEEHVSLEIAKLAKEKGFDLPTPEYYTHAGSVAHLYTFSEKHQFCNSKKSEEASRPTKYVLQAWLRIIHKIHISIITIVNECGVDYYKYQVQTEDKFPPICGANLLLEGAENSSLKIALNLIK